MRWFKLLFNKNTAGFISNIVLSTNYDLIESTCFICSVGRDLLLIVVNDMLENSFVEFISGLDKFAKLALDKSSYNTLWCERACLVHFQYFRHQQVHRLYYLDLLVCSCCKQDIISLLICIIRLDYSRLLFYRAQQIHVSVRFKTGAEIS